MNLQFLTSQLKVQPHSYCFRGLKKEIAVVPMKQCLLFWSSQLELAKMQNVTSNLIQMRGLLAFQ